MPTSVRSLLVSAYAAGLGLSAAMVVAEPSPYTIGLLVTTTVFVVYGLTRLIMLP